MPRAWPGPYGQRAGVDRTDPPCILRPENGPVGPDRRAPPGLRLRGRARVGAQTLFGPLDLAVAPGRWTCLLGPSGVGKSTFLHLLAGIADGISFAGDLGAADGAPLAGRVALMAQADMLLPWLTARDNLLIGARLRGETPDTRAAEAMLERVGLSGMAARKPRALSGGQRQRVALARTLIEDRPVVLLDEPFSALDIATRVRMQDLAAALLRGRTILHVTHDPAEAARLGDHILLLTHRGLTELAPPRAPAPRPPDAPETLEATGALTRHLLACECQPAAAPSAEGLT
ncbi:ABC transporter ATP-binding protein [Mesobaculum littorinae]|uniref:ABC transporter ATP-binding protein n=1 Tax=Mesobaculum littorinae TaxID=2486419 RepID=A0A438AMI2_9RHOB|nr:ATP-binding cassette domain-containing protein [Mesobaculum littorinae]RVV99968.1 ABC transporter ATP-binding protein [Mesobaculum littorinae]